MTTTKITARNSRYLRAIKALFNKRVYDNCLFIMNAEASKDAPEKHVERYLDKTGEKGDNSEAGIIEKLGRFGRSVK